MLENFKKVLLICLICSGLHGNNVFASDNVLQAIQIEGAKDSYNIILKSDDVADVKKTIQAPNKMMLVLKGIRASKSINTIYSNTSSVDSVVVEPKSEDSVKILIQAVNVSNARVHFDSLKTPLGVLDNSQTPNKTSGEIVLSGPMNSYKPVYQDNKNTQEETGFAFASSKSTLVKYAKRILKNDKLSWMVAFGLFSMLLLSGMKLIKGKDNDIKIGLRQSLQSREIDLYKGMNSENMTSSVNLTGFGGNSPVQASNASKNISGTNYGLKAYQNGTRNPYATPETQRSRPMVTPVQAPNTLQQAAKNINLKTAAQNSTKMATQMAIPKSMPASTKPKTANIDSMKFLESMTKIYEKNGRTDLAQGLKSNMKKAQLNLG